MMRSHFFYLLINLLMQTQLNGQSGSIRYLFFEWRHKDRVIVLGEMFGSKFLKRESVVCPLDQLTASDLSHWLGPSAEDARAFIYVHGMWGQQRFFLRKTLRSFDKALQAETGVKTVITCIWHAGGPFYLPDWRLAAGKGEALGPVFAQINAHFQGQVTVFCHSMGCRFFEGVQRAIPENAGMAQHLLLFSPDLDTDTSDPDFHRLYTSASAITIFMHRHDLLLFFSSLFHRKKRLGRSGADTVRSNLKVIDMTGQVHDLQNHTHFNKKWGQERINGILRDY